MTSNSEKSENKGSKSSDPGRRVVLKAAVAAIVAGAVAGAGAWTLKPEVEKAPETITKTVTKTVTGTPVTTTTTPKTKIAPPAIKLGRTAPVTGYLAGAEGLCKPMLDLWLSLVNAKGGIYVEEYGQSLPVQLIQYNDCGEVDAAIRLTERLVTEDKVDILWGSYGAFMGFALQPIVNKLKVPLIIPNAYPILVEDPLEYERLYLEDDYLRDKEGRPWMEWNYIYWVLAHPYWAAEANYKLMLDLGIETYAWVELETLSGVVSRISFESLVERFGGPEQVMYKSYPWEVKDFGPIITDLEQKKPDAVLHYAYPDDGWLAITQYIERDYNPPYLYMGVGVFGEPPYSRFGANLEGVAGYGTPFATTCNDKVCKGVYGNCKWMNDVYWDHYGEMNDVGDGVIAFACGEVIEQAIERAGSLDPEEIQKAMIATKDEKPFKSIIGPQQWDKGPWPEQAGVISQWIGIEEKEHYFYAIEGISAAQGETAGMPQPQTFSPITGEGLTSADHVTHKPLYPKPEWKR